MNKMNSAISWLAVVAMAITACSSQMDNDVPGDFYMMMDVRGADNDSAQNINVTIHANGRVEYDIYSTGGVIRYDENEIVQYEKNQIVQDGKLKLTEAELSTLWNALNENKFFELDGAYQMAIGNSYAFILVEADGRKHKVDNIGIEVPEIRALVETVAAMMPENVKLEYRKGYIP